MIRNQKDNYEFSWKRVAKKVLIEVKFYALGRWSYESLGYFQNLKDAFEFVKKHEKINLLKR